MKDLISVVINVYNGEKYIKKCLDLVSNQTYKNLEILIINDGSKDNTLNICKEYKDDRIRIITTKNLGLSLSRNVGLDNAKGNYIYFLDVDDLIDNDIIEYLYKLCKKNKALISTCMCNDTNKYEFIKDTKKEIISKLSSKDMLKKVLLSTNREVAFWNKLIHRSLVKDLRFEDRIINDVVVTYKLVMSTDKIVYSNLVKYYHYNNSESISNKKELNLDRNIDRYNACLERYNYIKERCNIIENDIALMQCIARLYRIKSKDIKDYLKDEGALKLYKKLYTNKIFKCKLNKSSKIKLLLFRISPSLHNLITNLYLKIKKV